MNDEIERLSRRVAQLEAIDIGQRIDSVIRVKYLPCQNLLDL